MPKLVACLLGTRPEAIKLAPLVRAINAQDDLTAELWVTDQQGSVVDETLAAFDLTAGSRVRFERTDGSLSELAAVTMVAITPLLRERKPSALLVQGDTLTALIGALVGFWEGIPVVHLEAGLRTLDLTSPFPEEANRQLIGRVAALHLAPTELAVAALESEGISTERILLTGNTVVDAAQMMAARAADLPVALAALLERRRRLVVVTAHRRESWGQPIADIADAVADLAAAHPDVGWLFVTHPNPAVRTVVEQRLTDVDGVVVVGPVAYDRFLPLIARADLVLSDSGGIQEEAPSVGVPALVLRDHTERTEGIDAGVAKLIGTDPRRIRAEVTAALDGAWTVPPGENPYGDGHSADRCAHAIAHLLGCRSDAARPWVPLKRSPHA